MSRGRRLGLLGLVVVVAVLAGMILVGRPAAPRLAAAMDSPSSPAQPSPTTAPTQAPGADLGNLDDDIGSIMVVSTRGTDISPALRALLTDGKVGGLLLFGSNFGGSAAGLKAWSDRLQAIASSACLDHPILLMTDEEGGQVAQVRAGFAPPSELVAGAGGPDHVRALERTSAVGLRSAGLGLDLAPVADVRTNPLDNVIGDRSFGSNTGYVAPLVTAAVQGLHDGGVGATLKHFPGLGGAAGDPHVAIPTDPESEAQWERVQMPTFQAGIAAGADAVMTTAVYVPGLGGGTMPAMLSAPVVSKLRTQLGFGGVIMTDSLSMGGIGARWSLPDAAVLAVAAGNDLVLLSNGDPGYEADAMAAVRAAVLSGRLDRSALHASAMRVNALRDKFGRRFVPCRTPISA
ncbi:MAG TPA: glycoside hydrolase family 3 N-terminal domain-containing protein [Candidatus Dormibacteraeota bacterium]|nr:glycoside hydrolase family 3 N-terminal domain-containing protein [Candidatus Dormibacteraeota bacterium]